MCAHMASGNSTDSTRGKNSVLGLPLSLPATFLSLKDMGQPLGAMADGTTGEKPQRATFPGTG